MPEKFIVVQAHKGYASRLEEFDTKKEAEAAFAEWREHAVPGDTLYVALLFEREEHLTLLKTDRPRGAI